MKARIRPWAAGLGGEQLNLDILIYSTWAMVAIAIGSLVGMTADVTSA